MKMSMPNIKGGSLGRYAAAGFLIGILVNVLAFWLEAIVLDISFTADSFLEHFRREPLHWILALGPLVLALVVAEIGRRQDKLDQLNASLQEKIEEATRQLSSDMQFFRTLVHSNPLAIVILDQDERIMSINPAFESLFQYRMDEVIGQELDPLITNEEMRSDAIRLTRDVLDGGVLQHSAVRLRKGGAPVNVDIQAVQVLLGGDRIGALAIYEDVSERVAYQEQLNRLLQETSELAKTDVLTGLFNRRAITEAADGELSRAMRTGRPCCFMVLDIDGFKEINDEYGHLSGDMAIRAVAEILNANKRAYDYLGRWGGDEFMLVLPETGLADALRIGQRICDLISGQPIQLVGNHRAELTVSIGLSEYSPQTGKAVEGEDLFQEADKALYQSKSRGKNQVSPYSVDG
jgi:diguanylate cyclase (GGDEF)-like protein